MKKSLFLLPLLLFSKEVTLEFISSKPTSIAKDYYIWRFLDQNITATEANEAFYQVKNVNRKIFLRYAKKSGDKEFEKIAKCMKLKPKEFLKADGSCIAASLTPYKFIQLNLEEKKRLLKKVKRFEKTYKILSILSSKYPFELLLENEDIFFEVFNSVGDKYRETILNKTIPKETLERLKKEKQFDSFVNIVITNPKLKKLHYSFFEIKKDGLSSYSSFLIGINAIRYGLNKKAKDFLEYSKEKSYYTFDIDKCNFWLYQITKSKKYLKELANSSDINIYSLYAQELLNKRLDIRDWTLEKEELGIGNWELGKNENLKIIHISNSPTNHKYLAKHQKHPYSSLLTPYSTLNINDPFTWLEILKNIKTLKNEELKKYAQNFKTKELLPVYAFIMEKYYRYKIHFFFLPYEDILKNLDKKEKALIYAIARQESRFIPSSISHSFALGSFQIMPFLAKAIAKEKNLKEFDLDEMFDVKKNIDFALYHLRFLKRKLNHPILIAYAYNGGIGFVKRKVIKNGIFKGDKYQPFLGMELVPYPEPRKYGKKVLANFLIYSKILGEKESLNSLIKKLVESLHNHRS